MNKTIIRFTFFWALWFALNAAYAGYLFSKNSYSAWIHTCIAIFSLLMFVISIFSSRK